MSRICQSAANAISICESFSYISTRAARFDVAAPRRLV